MLTHTNRKQARSIGATLNIIAGSKRFVQARTKSANGWGIVRTAGILKLPRVCPPRNNGYSLVLSQGVVATFKPSRKRAITMH